ncbi:MAG: MAE_28990/MAE_18760 family HEPN-like nuclease [Chitinophagales bacterium]|nr:MAE_28990/MAE_18760 family HEPN-like nuclease [Chitinophagales bacterium]
MVSVRNIFNERAKEIETYFVFLQNYLSGSKDTNLNKIFKSNMILMLYNIVESTVSNAIEEIHSDIHRNNISFNSLKVELKKSLIKFMKGPKSQNPQDFVADINDLAVDIVKKCFNKEKISNGNIDSKHISQLGITYGFSCNTTYSLTKNGGCLQDIKGKRNDLAHGIFSFTEVGEKYATEDLENMKNETVNYLNEIINNIERYLINQEYLHVPVVAA